LVEAHVKVLLAPLLTEVGAAVSVTVGAGVVLAIATEVVAWAVPPAPVQLRLNVAAAFNAPVVSFPETAFAPLQVPDAEHEVALVLDQVNMLVPPALTVTGLADNVTVGPGAPLLGGLASLPPPHAVRKLTNVSAEIRRIDLMAAIIRNRSSSRC
jgi:hypothetical protein